MKSQGKVIYAHKGYQIRQKNIDRGEGKQQKTESTEIIIYAGKKIIKEGFKSKEKAIKALHELVN